ncbi:hypothetical protein V8C37DRAFT_366611 [Trichoderma ceciliae]
MPRVKTRFLLRSVHADPPIFIAFLLGRAGMSLAPALASFYAVKMAATLVKVKKVTGIGKCKEEKEKKAAPLAYSTHKTHGPYHGTTTKYYSVP